MDVGVFAWVFPLRLSGKAIGNPFPLYYSVPFFNEPFGEIGVAKPNIPNRVGIIGFRWVSLGFGRFQVS